MIFLDTSAIYALADSRDENHAQALAAFGRALADREELLVHNYVVVESVALLQRRLGQGSALQLLADSRRFAVHWVSEDDHAQAAGIFAERRSRDLSFVDCVSFTVMRKRHVTLALAFDRDFVREGFSLYR